MVQGFGIVCPRCRHLNHESSTSCSHCQALLSDEKPKAAVRAPVSPAKAPTSTAKPLPTPATPARPAAATAKPAAGTAAPKPALSGPTPSGSPPAARPPTTAPNNAPAANRAPPTATSTPARPVARQNTPVPPPSRPNNPGGQAPTTAPRPTAAPSAARPLATPTTSPSEEARSATSSATHGRFSALLQAAKATGDFDDALIEDWMRDRGISNAAAPMSADAVPPGFLEAFRQEALEDSRISESTAGSTPSRLTAFPSPDELRPGALNPAAQDVPMEWREQIICSNCGALILPGHKFCGKCGTSIEEINARRPPTAPFGPLQEVGKAKLVLIKGEGLDGISYHLNAREHVAGRSQGAILFPDDPFLSPRHAAFFYRDGRLFLRDEGSLNGVYIRLREPVPLNSGDFFLCGEEIFRFEGVEPDEEPAGPDGTYFFSSPKRRNYFRLVQILVGGREGLRYHAKRKSLIIGRERCDLNFPLDRFISGSHSKVESTDSGYRLSDMGSRNGTFIRIHNEIELHHGDYVFLGQQLLRVEVTLT